MLPLLAALAAPAPPEDPFLRTFYVRAALGMSTLSMSGVRRGDGIPERRVSANGIWALAMDFKAGVVVGDSVALGLALHTTSSGASADNGTSRESVMTMFHVAGPFVVVYPAPRLIGFHVGSTLGYALSFGGDAGGTGPAIAPFIGFDTRGERWSVHSFDFRLAYAPVLRGYDSVEYVGSRRVETRTTSRAFALGFQYSIGWR
jgi:hypothetical protein